MPPVCLIPPFCILIRQQATGSSRDWKGRGDSKDEQKKRQKLVEERKKESMVQPLSSLAHSKRGIHGGKGRRGGRRRRRGEKQPI